jgi:hypothetical protein
MKKDYLFGGAMADSADLVVLGAWFGTGQKGKILRMCASRSLHCLHIHIQGYEVYTVST